MNYDDLSEQLDRNLELLKRYEVEKMVDKTIEKLQELSEEQDKLSDEVKDKNNEQEDLLNKQKEQSEEFEKAIEEYKKAQEKNSELKNPMKLDEFNEKSEDIKNEFQEGEENMSQEKNNKASKNQSQNSQKLNNMASAMQSMMQQNQSKQDSENMDDLRQIIENTITFSFDQEKLMQILKNINRKDPMYMEYLSEQNKISDNFEIIKDSLNALAKRSPMLNKTINKEIKAIEKNINKSLDYLEDNRGNSVSSARSTQQYVMTSANNLALLLSEILKQMQQQSCQKCSGKSNCTKPGKGKPKLSDLKGQQQSIKDQMKSMIKKMKDGKGQFDKNSLNKQLAKMLAQQEIFKDKMGKLMNNGSLNPETMRKLNEIKRMVEQTENDIINKNVTQRSIKRQDLILTKLLKAENSEYQREIDKKRKSEKAKIEKIGNPKEFFEYKRLNKEFNEILNTSDIKLYKYYNEKYKQYLINLNK